MSFRHTLEQDRLRKLYTTWLGQVVDFGRGPKAVAGSKTRKGFESYQEWTPQWQALLDAWQSTPEKVWVWSDLHLGHRNILAYSKRPFDSLHRMHQVMLENAQHLQHDDLLVFGGDVSFLNMHDTQRWLQQLPTRHLHLIAGNHDVDRSFKMQNNRDLFGSVIDCLALPSVGSLPKIWMTHYPLHRPDIPKDVLNVHGHIHQHLLERPHVNMCVEHVQYRPQRLLDLIQNP